MINDNHCQWMSINEYIRRNLRERIDYEYTQAQPKYVHNNYYKIVDNSRSTLEKIDLEEERIIMLDLCNYMCISTTYTKCRKVSNRDP